MFAGIYMIMVFDPQILFNDGFYDLMEVRIPDGTLLKPLKPAALSCRTHALGRIFDVLGGLLGQGNPDVHVRGRVLRQPALHVLGLRPATASGTSCTRSASAAFPASPSATVPTAIRCGPRSRTCRTSSSRATFRCASTPTRRSRTPADRASTGAATAFASAIASSSRARSRSTTIAGSPIRGASMAACPVRAVAKLLQRADGSEQLLPSKADRIKVEPGDLLYFDTWGGGGCGDPLERDPAKVHSTWRRASSAPRARAATASC